MNKFNGQNIIIDFSRLAEIGRKQGLNWEQFGPVREQMKLKYLLKQFFMNENKRLTRSSTSSKKGPLRDDQPQQNKELEELRLSIEKAINENDYNEALQLIQQLDAHDHWIACNKARALFQLGHTQKSISQLKIAFDFQRKQCNHCVSLLLKLASKNKQVIKKFQKVINVCLNQQNVPNQMHCQLEQMKTQINHASLSLLQTSKQYQNLTTYYSTRGVKFKKLQIVETTNEYRKAIAKTTIKPDQVIIFVPQQQIITLQTAKSIPEVHKLSLEESRLRSPKHCMLSVFLLIQMSLGKSSRYYNYIKCLPTKLDNFPVYYTEKQEQQLQGTYFLSVLNRKKIDIKQDYEEILQIVPSLNDLMTFQAFMWARMIISSRIFGIMIQNKKTDALVPIADMLNHKTPKSSSWYFCDKRKGFIIQNCGQEIQKGEQIFDSYGTKCNSRFLLNYGFTMPANDHNQVLIVLKRIKKSKILPPNIKLTTCLQSQQFRTLLSYYREYAQAELNDTQIISDESKSELVQFSSSQNQCAAWRAIKQTMEEQLADYKTKDGRDKRILRSALPVQQNLKNCVQIRLGERAVLQFYARMAKKMIQYFTTRNKKVDSLYDYYIKTQLLVNFE